MKEIKIVKGYEWLGVDEDGNTFSSRRKMKPYKAETDRHGYKRVNTKVDGKGVKLFVHRAVAIAFIPNPLNLPFVNHKNGIKEDNRVENLEWCTAKQNTEHAIRTGLLTFVYGEDTSNNKYSEKIICEICQMIEDGYRNIDICKKVGVDRHLPKDIRNGNSWTHISKNYKLKVVRRGRLSVATVEWVCSCLQSGWSVLKIFNSSKSSNVSKSHIKHIKARNTYKDISCEYTW